MIHDDIDGLMAFWSWKPNKLYTIRQFFQRVSTIEGSFSAGEYFIKLESRGGGARSWTEVPTTLEALNDIEKIAQRARKALIESGGERLMERIGIRQTMKYADLEKELSADPWFEKFGLPKIMVSDKTGLWTIVEHLKGKGLVKTDWTRGDDGLPNLTVMRC